MDRTWCGVPYQKTEEIYLSALRHKPQWFRLFLTSYQRSKLAEVVLAALKGKVQQISGLEHRLDEINEIPKNERRLKSVEEHLKMLEQEEQKYQTLRRQLYEDMSSGIVSRKSIRNFPR